jgi:hypothetical protein
MNHEIVYKITSRTLTSCIASGKLQHRLLRHGPRRLAADGVHEPLRCQTLLPVLWRVAVRGLHAAYYHPWLPACDWNEHARGWPQGTWFADEVRLIERI